MTSAAALRCRSGNTAPSRRLSVHQRAFTGVLEAHEVRISMDGRGRVFDNIFVERLWGTVKYEDIYFRDYGTIAELDVPARSPS